MNLFDEFSEDELRLISANLLPLKKLTWNFSRGARDNQEYVDLEGNVNIVEKYHYIWGAENRNIEDFTRSFTFYDDSGNELFSPIDTTPDKDVLTIDEINESIRIRQIRYLKTATKKLRSAADELPPQVDQATLNNLMSMQYVHPSYNTPELYLSYRQGLYDAADALDYTLTHYSVEITNYEKFGTLEFEQAVENETDPIVLSILDATLRPPDSEFPNGLTGRQSIMYQLRGIVP